MTPPNPPVTPGDELDIETIEYPAGARFIGPGDDVVISAEKLQAYITTKCLEARKAVLEDISQRMNYDDYSGLEVSKAWKKLYYHVEGSLDAVKRQELAALRAQEDKR